MSTNLGAQERPSWLPAGAAPAAAVPAPPPPDPRRLYAEWFAWARRNTPDLGRCHAAAAAAVGALAAGQDHASAARVAQAAALAPDAPTRPVTVDAQTQAYAGYFAYATVDHKMDSAGAHAYAQSALGQPAPVYAAAPTSVAPMPRAGLGTRIGTIGLGFSFESLFMDPAGRACLYGILCLVAPFVVHIYFPVLPVLGLLYGLRAMGRSNPILGMAALVLNGLALLLTASIFFGLV